MAFISASDSGPTHALWRVLTLSLALVAVSSLLSPASAETVDAQADVELMQPVTVPLVANVQHNHARDAILMSLKEKWTKLSMLEEGATLSTAAATSKEIPLDVEILKTKHLATYYGVIEMDNTKFKVLFDTGSCEFWVPSAHCNTARCRKHSRLPIRNNRDIATRNALNIQYLSGKVQGDLIYETVKLGDITVKKQVVGLAKVVDIDLLDDVRWDGIMGLAYPNPALSARGITPIFDTIIKSSILTNRHLSNQFAYYIDDTRGAVTFGGADCQLIASGEKKAQCIDQFKFVPVTEKTYWTITIKDVKIKYPHEKKARSGFCPEGGCKAIVDTGTYLIYGPENQVTSMVTSNLKSCHKHREMPTFTFDFHVGDGEDPVSVELAPIDYILKFNMDGKKEKDCVVGISPDKDTIWTLGQVFLRSFYTVFDRDSDRIGFARLPRSNFKALNSRSTMKVLRKRRRQEKRADSSLLQTQSTAKLSVAQRLRERWNGKLTDVASTSPAVGNTGHEESQIDRGHDKDNMEEQTHTENHQDPEEKQKAKRAVVMDGLRHVHYS